MSGPSAPFRPSSLLKPPHFTVSFWFVHSHPMHWSAKLYHAWNKPVHKWRHVWTGVTPEYYSHGVAEGLFVCKRTNEGISVFQRVTDLKQPLKNSKSRIFINWITSIETPDEASLCTLPAVFVTLVNMDQSVSLCLSSSILLSYRDCEMAAWSAAKTWVTYNSIYFAWARPVYSHTEYAAAAAVCRHVLQTFLRNLATKLYLI